MKLSQNICSNDILDEFEYGSGWLKNMAARWRGSFSLNGYSKTLLTL